MFGPTQEQLKLALLTSWTLPLLISSLSLFNYNCVIPDIVCKAEELNFSTCGFTPPSKLFWTLCPPYNPGSLKLNRSPGSDVSAVELNTEWKKDELQVSFIMLRDCWRHYETTVRDAKRKCLSDINLSNCHKPCVRFKTIDSILIVLQTVRIEVSPAVCESFLHFYYWYGLLFQGSYLTLCLWPFNLCHLLCCPQPV